MALPKQVRQQIEDAKRIEGELASAAATPPADAAAAPVPDTPAATPVAAAPEAAPAPAPQPQPDAQYAELLQQYRSLQGIHRTLVRSNSELQSKAQGLQQQVNELTAQADQLRQQLSAPPAAPVSKITDAEVQEFGPDLISVIERKAQEVAAPLNEALARVSAEAEALKRRNAELEQSMNGVSQVQASDAQARFQTDLLRLVPDFDALNFDGNFLSWLSQVDQLDARRRTLQERLNEAVEMRDVQAVANYFNTFKQLVAAAQAQAPRKPDLAAQAQPASRAGADAPPAQDGPVWTGAAIAQFYADVARGKYAPAEKQRIEREIYAAQNGRRIAA